ncbi:MAG: AEC family transporter [Hyphomicrobiales bacterium]|nr:AEC family transporter [Hyphomicrobiales bacterium]MCP5370099.1 AEC family transporter [Hyphomicrobiales bacterium]
MGDAVLVTLPFFAVILGGWLAGKRRLLSPEGIVGLNSFVFLFALPCLLFRSMATRPIAEIADLPFLAAYAGGGLPVFALAALGGRLLFRHSPGLAALQGQGSVVGNVGFLGLPLVIGLLGTGAALPVMLCLLVDLLVMVPLSIAFLERDRGRRDGQAGGWRGMVRSLVVNPFVLSMGGGIAWSATGIALPGPVDSLTALLGAAAGPAALFALGATLAGRPLGHGFGEAAYLSVFKLAVHPLAVWLVMVPLTGTDPLWATAAVLVAACPVAGNLFVVARAFGVYTARASAAVLVSTAAGIATFSLIAGLIAG